MTTAAPRNRTSRVTKAVAEPATTPETEPAEERVQRTARRGWVRLGDVQVNPLVQREFVPAKADEIAAQFNPEHFGTPVVNIREGRAWMIDGQHRAAALKKWLGEGWEDQQFEAEIYDGLTEIQEADAFLRRNNSMAINAYNKFRIAVVAGWEDEQTVAGIVAREGLTISRDKGSEDNRVLAVGTLLRVYRRAGGPVLGRTLAIIRDAYGAPGLEASVIAGMSMVVHRYDNLDDRELTDRLARANGGVGGMLGKAERSRKETGNPKHFCVAGAIVDTFNSLAAESKGGNGVRLMSWWKATAEA
jgi:Family of unknown function (DUF6551)